MNITYLCGGINGLNNDECNNWRSIAKELLKTDTLDPMRRDYRGQEQDNVNNIITGDLLDILNSKYILVNATRPSWGTAMELVYAKQFNKIIIAFVENKKISPWLEYHSNKIAYSLNEAIQIINNIEEINEI